MPWVRKVLADAGKKHPLYLSRSIMRIGARIFVMAASEPLCELRENVERCYR